MPPITKISKTVWQGPESNEPNGGITYSLLCRFLSCRERFRLLVCEGLKPTEGFSHRLEYGNMWHICEQAHAAATPSNRWEIKLDEYARELCHKHPTQQEQIEHWYGVCKIQFPIYIDYWSKHKDVASRRPLLQEEEFNVRYPLPSGKYVRLRGKWDSVDLIGEGNNRRICLQENKTKGDINEAQLLRQLSSGFDLQTMLYITALTIYGARRPNGTARFGSPISGIRYNVVRRPLSGGRYTIVRHKPSKANPHGESKAAYYKRLAGLIASEPEYFFMRWNVEIHQHDIMKFRRECLDPILEQICEWYECMSTRADERNRYSFGNHYRYPYGVYNPLLEGNSSDLDTYIDTGSEIGLTRTTNLFPELGG